jgi:hypothetical protein
MLEPQCSVPRRQDVAKEQRSPNPGKSTSASHLLSSFSRVHGTLPKELRNELVMARLLRQPSRPKPGPRSQTFQEQVRVRVCARASSGALPRRACFRGLVRLSLHRE